MQTRFPGVLLVEDDPFILSLLATISRRAGWNPITVKDGEEALAALRREEPDAMILDLLLPRVDGFTLLRHLRQAGSSLLARTIVISGAPEPVIRAQTSLDDVACFLPKPIDINALQEAMLLCQQRILSRKGPQAAPPHERHGEREVS